MSGPAGAFADPGLARLLGRWNARWAGCELFRTAAGLGWLSLHLQGTGRPAILLTALPGATVILAHTGPLPAPLGQVLAPTRDHPLCRLLQGGRLLACGALTPDRVACFHLTDGAGRDLFLLHKVFGAQGALSLLDSQAKLLWGSHRPPHPLLAAVPPSRVWTAAAENHQEEDHQEPDPGPSPAGEPPGALDLLAAKLAAHLAGQWAVQVKRLQRTTDRLVENVTADLANADRGEAYRRSAEALAANLHRVRQGQNELATIDLRDGSPLTIPLDPALSPAANLDAWFRKAGKAEKGRTILAERLQAATTTASRLAAALQELLDLQDPENRLGAAGPHSPQDGRADPMARLASLQRWRADHRELLPGAVARTGRSRNQTGPEEPLRPFRRYLIDGRWEAWVGRSNQENDELTHRASHPTDLWLHAQGVPGSHVILRTQGHPEQIPHRVLEKAAALAALHSKARHSGLVPVVYTERRYVRKPRKSAPGIAVCQREKTLFVAPAVAEGVVLA